MSARSFSLCVLSFLLCGAIPAPARAQANQSHWGVNASFTPQWTLMEPLRKLMFDEQGTLAGREFTIGVVRGSTRGGDWGVSFVRKPFTDGSGSTEVDSECFPPPAQPNQCATMKTTSFTRGVYLNGVQVHKFFRFANIKDRVQVGMNVGGGIASVKGQVVETTDGFEVRGFNPQTGRVTLSAVHSEETQTAKEELLPLFPLLKVEAAGAVILTPSLKLQIAGGLNFPSRSFRTGVVYLIGAR
jgi:hypothetical protein